MKVININVVNDIYSFVDALLKKFADKNENYVLIRDYNSFELHFEGYIVRLRQTEYSRDDKIFGLSINDLDKIELGTLFDKLANKNILPNVVISDLLNVPETKYIDLAPKRKKTNNPALKKLKKNDYKGAKSSIKQFKNHR